MRGNNLLEEAKRHQKFFLKQESAWWQGIRILLVSTMDYRTNRNPFWLWRLSIKGGGSQDCADFDPEGVLFPTLNLIIHCLRLTLGPRSMTFSQHIATYLSLSATNLSAWNMKWFSAVSGCFRCALSARATSLPAFCSYLVGSCKAITGKPSIISSWQCFSPVLWLCYFRADCGTLPMYIFYQRLLPATPPPVLTYCWCCSWPAAGWFTCRDLFCPAWPFCQHASSTSVPLPLAYLFCQCGISASTLFLQA